MATLNQTENPYVGPRTFQPEERAKFFGRSREARELTSQIIANRLVLFYAPSGAGKSSLLNTMVRPMLEDAGFEVLPTGRVSGYSGTEVTAENIFVYNLLSALHESQELSPDFVSLTIAHFLDNLTKHEDGAYYYDPAFVYPLDAVFKPRVLIIDQFEELITTSATLWPHRTGFFKQLAEAMALDDQLWVVLTMREDYVASFDPYLHLTPNRLRNRYYMERLSRPAAIEAMQMPVKEIRPFTPEAIEKLVDNLLRLPKAEDQDQERFAQFVEPVQLQTVCFQMWEGLRQQPGEDITIPDVERFANVEQALTNFYEETVKQAVHKLGVSEVALRDWFEHELITEAGTRNMVYRGEEKTGSLPTRVADHLRSLFILSDVVRPGGMWYELVHDRFVPSIVKANNLWRQNQPLIRLAMEWDKAGRPADQLLSGLQLEKLEDSSWQGLGAIVAEYISVGRERQAEEAQRLREEAEVLQKERANASRLQRLTRQLGAAIVVTMMAVLVALYLWNIARNQAEFASDQAELARDQAELASSARATAESSFALAVAAQGTSEYNATVAFLQSTRASEARATAESQSAANANLQATYLALAQDSQNLVSTLETQAVEAEETRGILLVTINPSLLFPAIQTPTPNATATAQAQELLDLQASATAVAAATAEASQILPANVSTNAVILDVPYRSQWDDDANEYSVDGGSAALAMLLNAAGIEITTNEVYDYLPPKSSDDSTSVTELLGASRAIGVLLSYQQFVDAESALLELEEFIDDGKPFIVLVKYEPWQEITGNSFTSGAFVLVVGYDDDSIYIHDPHFGLWAPRSNGTYFQLSPELFLAGWGGFSPLENPNFAAMVPEESIASRLILPTPSP